MAYCSRCGSRLNEETVYCPKCGKRMLGGDSKVSTACINHPGKAAIKSCDNCGRLLCSECTVVLGEGNYCQPCVQKFISDRRAGQPEFKKPNWFQRHLNWTLFFGWLIIFPLPFLLGAFLVFSGLYPEHLSEFSLRLVGFIVNIGIMVAATSWYLSQKNRNMFWVLMLFVPFGFIVLLALGNKAQYEY